MCVCVCNQYQCFYNNKNNDIMKTKRKKCMEVRFLLEVRQRKLIKGLSNIYPIRITKPGIGTYRGTLYSIGGVHLPHDMHSVAISDEMISAGLGFVCHLVFMSSKYLSIPLRYRLIYNCSRSAIQDDDDIFPLFRERVFEKEQFDRALVLLDRNIDLLLRMRGISFNQGVKERPHILAKLNKFIKDVVEINGEDNGI